MTQQEFIIEELKNFSPEMSDQIRALTRQIGTNFKELTDQDIKDMLSSTSNRLIVAQTGGKIVGMVTLLLFRIPYTKKAYIDDLVVDGSFRGHGLGTQLMEKALATAKEWGAAYVDFTARPDRVAGNSLYEKLGFKKRDTNVYRLDYSYEEN